MISKWFYALMCRFGWHIRTTYQDNFDDYESDLYVHSTHCDDCSAFIGGFTRTKW